MALTQVSTGGIKDGQVHTADLADAQITAGKLHADALDRTYTLGADGSNHYTFTGEGLTGAVNDPTLYLTRGKTYRFVNGNSSGAHPFRIQTTVNGSAGTEYNTGVTNNGGAGGTTIVFEVPHDAPDVLYYQCTSHNAMGGIFYITGALADGGVTTSKLANSGVTTAKIATGAVTADKIGSSAIVSTKLSPDSVTDAALSDSSSDDNLRAVNTNHIKTNAVTTPKIADLNITTAKIGDFQVTGTKIAIDSIDSGHYIDGSIDTAHIADAQITTAKLADGNISTAKLANSSVTADKIANDAVTGAKIGDDAVATANIGDGQVTDAKIAGMAASKLTGALPALDGSNLTNLPGGGKVLRVIQVNSTGEQNYYYYSQGNPWITTGSIQNVSANSRFLIFGRFDLKLEINHNSVQARCNFGSGGGNVVGGESAVNQTTSYQTTSFTAYDTASSTSNRSYYFNVMSTGTSSARAFVRNGLIVVLELDVS